MSFIRTFLMSLRGIAPQADVTTQRVADSLQSFVTRPVDLSPANDDAGVHVDRIAHGNDGSVVVKATHSLPQRRLYPGFGPMKEGDVLQPVTARLAAHPVE